MSKITKLISALLLMSLVAACSKEPIEIAGATGTPDVSDAELTARAPSGLPDFSLFTVTSPRVLRSDFPSVKRWYIEGDDWHQFRLWRGDVFSGERKHARTEAQGGLNFYKDSGWHVFEARMKYEGDGRPDRTYTLAQLFAIGGVNLPEIRIEIRSDGRIHAGFGDENIRISDDRDYSAKGRTFKVRLRTNGVYREVYFNGERKLRRRMRTPNGHYTFRWGVYSNEQMTESCWNTVSEIRRF